MSTSVEVRVNEKSFRLDLSYRSQLAAVKMWPPEPAETTFVLQHLSAGDVFFDLGSNWGLYTALASTAVGERGLVVACELNPTPFQRLTRLVNGSALTNVLAFNIALGKTSGEMVAVHKPWWKNDTAGFISQPNSSMSNAIATRSLDRLWEQLGAPRVRMAKLDVEGFEPVVVAGGCSFFLSGVTDYVLVEISSWTEERTGVHWSVVFREFTDHFRFKHAYVFEGFGLTAVNVREPANWPVNRNVLFSRNEITDIAIPR